MNKVDAMRLYDNKCAKCGCVLNANKFAHFHHLRSYSKRYNMSTMFDKYSDESTMKELNKTVLICVTCHIALHKELGKKVTKKASLEYIKRG